MLTYEKFVETIDRLEEAQILLAALELRIFTILEKNALGVRAIARKAKADPAALEALLNTLVTLEALQLKNGRYANTPEMYRHFCETSPEYKKGTVMLRKENYEEYGHLIQVLKRGRKFSGKHGPDNPRWRRLFTYAMHERSESRAHHVARHVARRKVGALLDLGAGPGSYSAAILKKDRSAQATLLDRRAALNVAREIWGKSALWKRMHPLPGDLFETPFGEGYRTVLFSNILHIYNPAENLRLLRKIHRALVPGGRVILVDFFLNEKRTAPYQASLFSLTMLLFTETGKTYTWKETQGLMKRAGFTRFERIPLPDDSGLLIGHKR